MTVTISDAKTVDKSQAVQTNTRETETVSDTLFQWIAADNDIQAIKDSRKEGGDVSYDEFRKELGL